MIRINLNGTPEWIRTTDLLLRRQTLNTYYPLFTIDSIRLRGPLCGMFAAN